MWRKTLVVPVDHAPRTERDSDFAAHARSMGGYECLGYDSPNEFFRTYLEESPRHLAYDRFLRTRLPSGCRVFSVASGRAVNEMRLLTRDHEVVCSDLAPVCSEATRHLFPGYRFQRLDIPPDPLPVQRFDAVLAFSFVYLLASTELNRFLERVADLLTNDGVLVVDPGGAADSFATTVLDELVLPVEAHLACAVANPGRRRRAQPRFVVMRKHHGYRYRNDEIIAAAARAGFRLEALETTDFVTEWSRSQFYRRYVTRVAALRRLAGILGRVMPYVRLFAFRLTGLRA